MGTLRVTRNVNKSDEFCDEGRAELEETMLEDGVSEALDEVAGALAFAGIGERC